MYEYRNVKTGEIVVTSTKVSGGNWEPVEQNLEQNLEQDLKQDLEQDQEQDLEQDQEPNQNPPKASRRKK